MPLSGALRAYFRSGWAFLIPYLAAYLLYWWLRWPVNPGAGGQASAVRAAGPDSWGFGPWSSAFCLLHVYWALHAINAVLAVIALVGWWRRQRQEIACEQAPPEAPAGPATPPHPSSSSISSSLALAWRIAPWVLLALIFWIPGVYLEWPADPWEHLRRINEWALPGPVGDHSSLLKAGYFLAFSIVGSITPPTRQLFWLDGYYAGVCLLLCWQYYRLARRIGLGERPALLFVLLQALLSGNNVFGFYRYYGISSTMFSQLGAVALVRLGLEAARGAWRPGTGGPPAGSARAPGTPAAGARLILSALLLAGLIRFNHVQGLGMAGLGLTAVGAWRLVAWRRSMAWWLGAAAVALSAAAVLWWPRHPALDQAYVPQGWLTPWYGFNLFALSSPSLGRALAIVGALGAVNLAAGLLLLRRNHVAAWLTLVPVAALCLPVVVIPFANALARMNVADIVVFHRMLLAIPAGLAIVCLAAGLAERSPPGPPAGRLAAILRRHAPAGWSLAALVALLVVPAGAPGYNRLWNVVGVPPADLTLVSFVAAAERAPSLPGAARDSRWVTTTAPACILNAILPRRFSYRERPIGRPATQSLDDAVAVLVARGPTRDSAPPSLNRDPLASDPAAWTAVAGAPPEFIAGITDFPAGSTGLRNPPGRSSHVFTADLIPVDPARTYVVEASARRAGAAGATAYLAVAWVDAGGRLLEAGAPAPAGAGSPSGWINGRYSYFGLAGDLAPAVWTTYRTSFGRGTTRAIPPGARFVRVGALLNDRGAPAAAVELTDLRLWCRSGMDPVAEGAFPGDEFLVVAVPAGRALWSPGSQAAEISGHWPAQQVATDLAGSAEIAVAARAGGGREIGPAGGDYTMIGEGPAAAQPAP